MRPRVSKIIGIWSDLERGENFVECLDASMREDLGNSIPNQTVRDHVHNIIWVYLQQHSVVTQYKILHGSIKHKALKWAKELLGFQDAKVTKVWLNVNVYISKELFEFRKSKKPNIWATHREITTIVVAPRTLRNQMVTICQNCYTFQEKHCTSILDLGFRYIKNYDESTCWALICRKPF